MIGNAMSVFLAIGFWKGIT